MLIDHFRMTHARRAPDLLEGACVDRLTDRLWVDSLSTGCGGNRPSAAGFNVSLLSIHAATAAVKDEAPMHLG